MNNTLRNKEIEYNANLHREIIEQSKQGNKLAQYQLYQQYSKAMYNICYRMMNSKEEAEDMLQDSFTYAFQNLETFRHESAFGAWMKQIVVNRCINEIKRKKTDLALFDDMCFFESLTDEPEIIENKMNVQKVKKAMQKLPEGSRMIFSLYLLEGYDHVEISQIMNISESTSKSQYMRARRRIKEILNEMNDEPR